MTWLRLLLIALWALGSLTDAAAHASLLTTTPADGAVLRTAPQEVVLQFDESVAPLAIRLVDEQGTAVILANARSEGTRLSVPLPALRNGAYVVSYRVASADSHPVAGSIAFTVGEGGPAAPATTAQAASSPGFDAAVIAARIVRDMLLLTTLGAALFAALVGPFPRQRAVLGIAGLGVVSAVIAELAVEGFGLAGEQASLHDAFRAAASTTAGQSAAGLCMGIALILPGAWGAAAAGRKVLLLGGALVAAASVGLTGHAASSQHPWLAMSLVACHVLVAGFWLGSLGALLLCLRREETFRFARKLRRFSGIAMPAVAILLAAGGTFAAMQLDALDDLRTSTYGKLVVGKLMLLLALLALAACNRFVLTARVEHSEQRAKAWLGRSMMAELVLLGAVLALTGVLSRSPPPSHASVAITRDLVGAGSVRGSVTVTPGRVGRNQVEVTLRDSGGQLLSAQDVSLKLSHDQSGIEPLERTLQLVAPGTWRNDDTELFLPGAWRLSVEGRVGDFDKFSLQAEVLIR